MGVVEVVPDGEVVALSAPASGMPLELAGVFCTCTNGGVEHSSIKWGQKDEVSMRLELADDFFVQRWDRWGK